MNDVVARTNNPPQIVVLRQRLDERRQEIHAALPPDISYPQFIRAIMTSMSLNPEIQACSWQSIWLSCLQACRDGLLPDGVEGAIVPYKSRASWVAMYQGLLRRFRRSGQFRWITANLVRKGDKFEHWIDVHGEHFHHEPKYDLTKDIELIYALATTKDDAVFVSVMSKAEADKHRKFSKNTREDSPWAQWADEMYKKTALRRLSKMLPSARDLMPPTEAEAPELPELEEAPEIAAPAPAKRTPAEELQHFADDDVDRPAAEAAPADRQPLAVNQPKTGGEEARGGDADRGGTPNVGVPVSDALQLAYERGKDWRAKGNARKATPPEYRTDDRRAEAAAWQAGYDGQPLPESQLV